MPDSFTTPDFPLYSDFSSSINIDDILDSALFTTESQSQGLQNEPQSTRGTCPDDLADLFPRDSPALTQGCSSIEQGQAFDMMGSMEHFNFTAKRVLENSDDLSKRLLMISAQVEDLQTRVAQTAASVDSLNKIFREVLKREYEAMSKLGEISSRLPVVFENTSSS
ncbi:hypothetical protein N7468_000747 [Penicillium chermesinum]|uniref:Uncharacterized protein n=1 Tax=Penicillium chermesinum TaxID=63820 RepID=A0A9W9PKW7_9EURO|nr:uncharacterized protein N7468_004185 [Penicillium chermesinum]XP_058336075.1 uncharacterized protein N7468_000747 [Penicillium chermesinum]KAJ5239566.1 hypothetical protein N7468_004185 [Penicillium chermesinum]KAJ5249296.1 hypothetical protein N7468_000747 [Penicillium chermesinum]KAJ6166460.1 hypothetical protein N7470_001907 [Penicillium chermesinum]